jgi:general secretion pathway protein A
MYLSYYNLKKEPFHITPDPDFLFFSESHKQALASIIYCTEKKKGFVAITGGVGLGKTTILRSYLERMDNKRLKTIYVFNPNIPFKSLVAIIFHELGIKPLSYDISDMVEQLHLALIEEYSAGNDVILIIDEAQNMPVDTLENLRMLSNLETSTDKLIQIVLIGQPELDDILNKYELRQLKQRIAIRATICPLTREESLMYIKHRLKKAGLKEGQLFTIFTKSALQLIIKHAKGIPRTINILCDNALINGFGYQQCPITLAIVKEVIADFKIKKDHFYLKAQYIYLTSLLLLFLIFWLSPYRPLFVSTISDLPFAHSSAVVARVEAKPLVQKKNIEIPKESKPKIEQAEKEVQQSEPLVRIIKKGDNLTGLIEDVYKIYDRKLIDNKLIELIKKNNPHIKNINKIPTGEKILFPAVAAK